MKKYLNIRAIIALWLVFAFLLNSLGPIPSAQAQDFALPKPGMMVSLSPVFNPPILKGIKVHPDNPFRFDFILDQGDATSPLKPEAAKLIKYFLASLTIPEKDLWVNLSPYEKNRIIPQSFGLTEMGRDLLAEDYMLKQITASLIYPEGETGKKFWNRIYEEASKKFGTTNIPVNTFNKVWIVPDKAVVYENAQAGTAYVVESKLKVMLEEDYLALQKHGAIPNATSSVGANIVREIVIPELTKEINEGKNFSQLRQVYNSLILATWYKKKIKDSILSQVYADKNKVSGVNIDDPQEKQRIYERYLEAFKKGAYNYIKDDIDPVTQQVTPRKYFSGGIDWAMTGRMSFIDQLPDGITANDHAMRVTVNVDAAQMVDDRDRTRILNEFRAMKGKYLLDIIQDGSDTIWERQSNAPSRAEKAFSIVLQNMPNWPVGTKQTVYDLFDKFFEDKDLPRLYVLHRQVWQHSPDTGLRILDQSIEHIYHYGQWVRKNDLQDTPEITAYSHSLIDTLYLLAQMDIAEDVLRQKNTSLKKWFEDIIRRSKQDAYYWRLREEISFFVANLIILQPSYAREHFHSDLIRDTLLEDTGEILRRAPALKLLWLQQVIRRWSDDHQWNFDGLSDPPSLFAKRIKRFLPSDGYRLLRQIIQPRLAGAVVEYDQRYKEFIEGLGKIFNKEEVVANTKLKVGDAVEIQVQGEEEPVFAVIADESQREDNIRKYFLTDFNLAHESYMEINGSTGQRSFNATRNITSLKLLRLKSETEDHSMAAGANEGNGLGWLMTDIERHDPFHFLYAVKTNDIHRLLDPERSAKNSFYSISLIDQGHMSTFQGRRIAFVLDFPQSDVLAVLRRMGRLITSVSNKSENGWVNFVGLHESASARNVLFKSTSGGDELRLSPQEIIRSTQEQMPKFWYAKNNEVLVRNGPNLRLKSLIFIGKGAMALTYRALFMLRYSDRYENLRSVMRKGLPVIIVSQDPSNLEQIRKTFMYLFPQAVEVSPYRFVFNDQPVEDRAMVGQEPKRITYHTKEELHAQLQAIKTALFAKINAANYDQMTSNRAKVEAYENFVLRLGIPLEEDNVDLFSFKGIVEFNKYWWNWFVSSLKHGSLFMKLYSLPTVFVLALQMETPHVKWKQENDKITSIQISLKHRLYLTSFLSATLPFTFLDSIDASVLSFMILTFDIIMFLSPADTAHELTHALQFNVVQRIMQSLNTGHSLNSLMRSIDFERMLFIMPQTPPNKTRLKAIVENIITQAEVTLAKDLDRDRAMIAISNAPQRIESPRVFSEDETVKYFEDILMHPSMFNGSIKGLVRMDGSREELLMAVAWGKNIGHKDLIDVAHTAGYSEDAGHREWISMTLEWNKKGVLNFVALLSPTMDFPKKQYSSKLLSFLGQSRDDIPASFSDAGYRHGIDDEIIRISNLIEKAALEAGVNTSKVTLQTTLSIENNFKMPDPHLDSFINAAAAGNSQDAAILATILMIDDEISQRSKDLAMTAGDMHKWSQAIVDRFNALKDVYKVVDMGSGDGEFSKIYREKYPHEAIIGYDQIYQAKYDKEWQVQGDARETRLMGESIDKVTINMPEPSLILSGIIIGMLKEAKRILKPGGEVNITFEVYMLPRAEDLILRTFKELGFEVEHAGLPLSQAASDYPRTALIKTFESKIGVHFFKARKPVLVKDQAQLNKTGGIDLSSDKALTVQNNGLGIKFHIAPAMLQQLQNAPGFVPVIINIQPMNDIRGFLGLNDKQKAIFSHS